MTSTRGRLDPQDLQLPHPHPKIAADLGEHARSTESTAPMTTTNPSPQRNPHTFIQ